MISRTHIRASLSEEPSATHDDILGLVDAEPEVERQLRESIPKTLTPAAVLVPLVERSSGWTVLLTQRAASLKDHAGQISFPGGRIEREDADAWRAALRETFEEIGLTPASVEFAGYLPDHWVGTGYRVTPAVGFVDPGYTLRIATAEVHDVFEVPLEFVFDATNHQSRRRIFGGLSLEVYDIPYGERNIWGATAGMLLTLRRLVMAHGR